MASEYEVECPMPECREALFLSWDLCLTLDPDDSDGHDPSDADVGTWKIECLAGHVLLLPTETLGCPCEDDGGGVNCPHDETDYDWSEDGDRCFRASDATRLRDVMARITAAP